MSLFMPLSENEILERDANRNIAKELLLSVKVISNKEHPIPKAKLVLGDPRRNAKHQLGKVKSCPILS